MGDLLQTVKGNAKRRDAAGGLSGGGGAGGGAGVLWDELCRQTDGAGRQNGAS